jgi:threonine dehydrogenase-like Zn-dependent dehydrogenase
MTTPSSTRCAVISPAPKSPVSILSFPLSAPPPHSITVKLDFAGICGTDPHLWKGDFPLPGPVVLGHEGIGTVLALHPSVTTDHALEPLKVGDRVYWTGIRPCGACYHCTVIDDECGCPHSFFMHTFPDAEKAQGTWATYTEVATIGHRNAFFKVDPAVPPEAFIALGCALPTMLQAVGKLSGGGIQRDDNVVVQGAGAVGLAAIMLAKLAGAGKVVVLEANELRMLKVEEFGADVCIDVKGSSREERKESIEQLVGHRGVGLVMECSGVLGAVAEGLDLLARNGKYLLVGTWAGKGEVPLDPFMVVNKAITILGSTYCAPRDYWRAVKVVEKNWKNFPLVSYVTHKFSLEQTQLGLETVLRGEAVKAVVEPGRA